MCHKGKCIDMLAAGVWNSLFSAPCVLCICSVTFSHIGARRFRCTTLIFGRRDLTISLRNLTRAAKLQPKLYTLTTANGPGYLNLALKLFNSA